MIVEWWNGNAVGEAIVGVKIFCAGCIKEIGPGGDAPQGVPGVIGGGCRNGGKGVVMDDMILGRDVSCGRIEDEADGR